MRIAVVGATGLVGKKMLQILEERKFPFDEIIPVASEKSVGQTVSCGGKEWSVVSLATAAAASPDIALFSAGGETSLAWAPKFAETGCVVIDNSSAWRMTEGVPLVVPEINASSINAQGFAHPTLNQVEQIPMYRDGEFVQRQTPAMSANAQAYSSGTAGVQRTPQNPKDNEWAAREQLALGPQHSTPDATPRRQPPRVVLAANKQKDGPRAR